MLLLARAVDDRTALNETNARKLYGPFLRPMSHVLGSQPMTEFGPGACTLATLGASNVTGRQSTTDGLLSSDLIRRIRHQPPTGRDRTNRRSDRGHVARPRSSDLSICSAFVSRRPALAPPRHATRFYDERSFTRRVL